MIDAIAPVLDRIATIESRFGPTPVLPVLEAASTGADFGGVMTNFDQPVHGGGTALAEPAGTPHAVAALTVAAPMVATRLPGIQPSATPVGGVPYADHFTTAGQRHGVPPKLLAAVGWVESRYQTHAVSPAGAEGLMQLMPFVSQELGVDPYDPAAAIDGAARLLASHHARFGSWELALAAYHSGASAVAGAGGIPAGRAATYVQRVTQRMEQT